MAQAFISTEEVERAISTVIQYLRDAGYDGAMEDGTGLADIVLKPNAILYSLFNQLVKRSKAYLSLADAQSLYNSGEITYDDYSAAVDGILSNWFVSRNQGSLTYGTVRYGMHIKSTFIAIKDGAYVAKCGDVTLVADGTQTFSEAQENIYTSDAVTLGDASYYIDIAVRSTVVTSTVIKAGASMTDALGRSDFASAEALSDFIVGAGIETTSRFIARTSEAITTRELITARAIRTVLLDKFALLTNVYVAGFGDPEQMRDQVTIEGITMHYGSKADIYLKTALTVYQAEVTPDANGNIPVTFLGDSPFARIYSVTCNDNPLDFTTEVEEYILGSHKGGLKSLTVTLCDKDEEEEKEHNYAVKWVGSPLVKSVHNFVYSDDQRVSCYDPLVRHMFPVFIKINFLVVKTSGVTADDETLIDGIKQVIIAYTLRDADSSEWSASELISMIHKLNYVGYIKLPVGITASLQDPSTGKVTEIPITNKIDINEFHCGSQQVSYNTIMPFITEDMINISVISE